MAYEIRITGFIGDPGLFGGDYFDVSTLDYYLAQMPQTETEVYVIITSGGGWSDAGFTIHDKLALLKQRVNTKIIGIAGSAATVIALSPKSQGLGGKIEMSPNADFYIHEPAWRPQSSDPLEAEQIQSVLDNLKANRDKFINFYSNITGASADFIAEKMKASTTFTAQEALKYGFVTDILKTNIQAATIYKFAAHVSKPNNAMQTIESKITALFEGFEAKMKTLFTNNEPAPAPVEPAPAKSEIEIANEKIAELEAKVAEFEKQKGEAVTQAVNEAKEVVEKEVTEKVTTELTAKFNTEFTALKNTLFTGDKLNPEFTQLDNKADEPKENISPIEAHRQRLLANKK